MKRLLFLPLFLAVFTFVRSQEEFFDGQSCTSIMAGRKATVDGSVITSHTCDGRYRTWLSVEPAADYPEGAMIDRKSVV